MTNTTCRSVLITGGSRGLGAAIAARLSSAGHRVLTPQRSELDLASPESVEAFISARGGDVVDVLVNNAGINLLRAIEEVDGPTWQEMLQVNLTSALQLTQAYAPAWQNVAGVGS